MIIKKEINKALIRSVLIGLMLSGLFLTFSFYVLTVDIDSQKDFAGALVTSFLVFGLFPLAVPIITILILRYSVNNFTRTHLENKDLVLTEEDKEYLLEKQQEINNVTIVVIILLSIFTYQI